MINCISVNQNSSTLAENEVIGVLSHNSAVGLFRVGDQGAISLKLLGGKMAPKLQSDDTQSYWGNEINF